MTTHRARVALALVSFADAAAALFAPSRAGRAQAAPGAPAAYHITAKKWQAVPETTNMCQMK